jgi:hypothetical protein
LVALVGLSLSICLYSRVVVWAWRQRRVSSLALLVYVVMLLCCCCCWKIEDHMYSGRWTIRLAVGLEQQWRMWAAFWCCVQCRD